MSGEAAQRVQQFRHDACISVNGLYLKLTAPATAEIVQSGSARKIIGFIRLCCPAGVLVSAWCMHVHKARILQQPAAVLIRSCSCREASEHRSLIRSNGVISPYACRPCMRWRGCLATMAQVSWNGFMTSNIKATHACTSALPPSLWAAGQGFIMVYATGSELKPAAMQSHVAALILSIDGVHFRVATRSLSNEAAVLIGLTDAAAAIFAARFPNNSMAGPDGSQHLNWRTMSFLNVR